MALKVQRNIAIILINTKGSTTAADRKTFVYLGVSGKSETLNFKKRLSKLGLLNKVLYFSYADICSINI
jgi:hypothetical protein